MEKQKTVKTLREAAEMEGIFISTSMAASIMGLSYNAVRKIIKDEKGEKLGIKTIDLGNQILIFKGSFLRAMGWTGKINGYD